MEQNIGLSAIADRYDVLLCDVWGVVHNGRESFAGACKALTLFAEKRGPVVLISNAPRPAYAVREQLAVLGVPTAAWSGFVTSGDVTRALLKDRSPGPVWALGPDRDAPLYDGLGLQFADLEMAAFICCTGPFDDTRDTPEDYRQRLMQAAARKLPMICANPDRVVQRGDSLIYCAGAIADLYAELGGQVLMAGKPFAPLYDLALREAARLAERSIERSRVLCIGDGVGTDIAGANAQKLDVLFISGGIHAMEGAATDLLSAAGAHAAYAATDLRW